MSEIVEVPDSPPRSPEVECPFSEGEENLSETLIIFFSEGSSEKSMETRKRVAEEAEGKEGDDDG